MITNDNKNDNKKDEHEHELEHDKNKNVQFYSCNACHYVSSRKNNFNRHLSTHKGIPSQSNNNDQNENENTTNYYACKVCKKKYKYRSGLSIHKKNCHNNNHISNTFETSKITPDLILSILKQNQELQHIILQQQNNPIITNQINNNTINSNNKTFNLNFFLNETCKDAMNIMDFVNSLQIQLSDLESIGELGFVNGLSKLIIKGLNELDENERPVHCSDLKRETMYVKDENKWEKEDSENTKMKKALRHIARKNTKMIPVWKEKHPDCGFSASHLSDKYNHIILESMGGSGDNDDEKANKIIKKISKEVLISKI